MGLCAKLFRYSVAQLLSLALFFGISHAVYMEVTNTADDGEGSFRQTLINANNAPHDINITFNISPDDPLFDPQTKTFTIYATSPLPDFIADHVIQVDGGEKIVLDGSRSKSRFPGLVLKSSGHTITGLTIQNFGEGGILVHGSDGRTVSDVSLINNRILDNGIFDENGNYGDGIRLAVNVKDAIIYDNLIARNRGNGIHFQSLTSAVWQNRVFGNFISANKKNGIRIEGSRNIIGINPDNNPTPNFIVQNNLHGILVNGSFGHGNHVAYNYIGIGPTGNKLGNRLDGVHFKAGAKNNRIGPGNKIQFNGTGIVVKGEKTRGTEITDNEILGNSNEGIYIENIALEPASKITSNKIQQNLLDGVHVRGGAPKIWSNHISGNQRYGIQLQPYDHDNPNIFEQTKLIYSTPPISDNRIERNVSGGLYALDTIFPEWERVEQKNEFHKNFDYDALVEWYHIFGFDPQSNDFGAMKVEISACTPEKKSCFGNEIREGAQGFFVGPDTLFNPRERNTFFKVTHFVVKDGLREDYSPHKITITGDQEKEFYLSDRDRARRLLDENFELQASSFQKNVEIEGPVHLSHFGYFGGMGETFKWVWVIVFVIVVFFLYHFWLAGHRVHTRERLFQHSVVEKPKSKPKRKKATTTKTTKKKAPTKTTKKKT